MFLIEYSVTALLLGGERVHTHGSKASTLQLSVVLGYCSAGQQQCVLRPL